MVEAEERLVTILREVLAGSARQDATQYRTLRMEVRAEVSNRMDLAGGAPKGPGSGPGRFGRVPGDNVRITRRRVEGWLAGGLAGADRV